MTKHVQKLLSSMIWGWKEVRNATGSAGKWWWLIPVFRPSGFRRKSKKVDQCGSDHGIWWYDPNRWSLGPVDASNPVYV